MDIIVSDVGGTNVRFARATDSSDKLADIISLKCADFPSIDDAFAAYRAGLAIDGSDQQRLAAVSIAVAAPVADGVVDVTNNHWRFDKSELIETLGADRLLVINDFTAQALAQSDPWAHGNEVLLDGTPHEGAPLLVIGPGTGLGVSALLPSPSGLIPLEGEGGHVSFAPRSGREIALYEFLAAQYDHVSAEHLVSGFGLEKIYQFLIQNMPSERADLSAPEIGTNALGAPGPCRDAACLLLDILGTVIADNVLTIGARGGVVIGGGIVPQLAPIIEDSNFAARIRASGVGARLTKNLPVWLCVDPYAGLRGALAGLNSAHLSARVITS